MLRLGLLVLCFVGAACAKAEPVNVTSRFATDDGTFELRAKIRKVETGAYGYPSTRCDYSVYRNGSFLHPADLEGGTTIGCDYIEPEEVKIEPIGTGSETVGWMLGVGGICGNTFSWKWTLVRPVKRFRAWQYEVCTFLAKNEPIVRPQTGFFEVWSQYQEWGRTGTSGSFFVPELRTVSRDMDEDRGIRRAELPADLDVWPELAYPSVVGSFVAGASQLNPALMVAAVRGCTDDDLELFRMHGLPTEREDIEALAAEVRRARELRQRLSSFDLQWDGACG